MFMNKCSDSMFPVKDKSHEWFMLQCTYCGFTFKTNYRQTCMDGLQDWASEWRQRDRLKKQQEGDKRGVAGYKHWPGGENFLFVCLLMLPAVPMSGDKLTYWLTSELKNTKNLIGGKLKNPNGVTVISPLKSHQEQKNVGTMGRTADGF